MAVAGLFGELIGLVLSSLAPFCHRLQFGYSHQDAPAAFPKTRGSTTALHDRKTAWAAHNRGVRSRAQKPIVALLQRPPAVTGALAQIRCWRTPRPALSNESYIRTTRPQPQVRLANVRSLRLGRTPLLSGAPPLSHDCKQKRFRRVHYSSQVRPETGLHGAKRCFVGRSHGWKMVVRRALNA